MSFKEIIGQEKAINYLIKSVEARRLYQSYIFVGPQGVGKFQVAKNFAKLLNCLQQDLVPCDKCSSCVKIENNNHPDIHFIAPDPSGFIGIGAVRELKRLIGLKPFEARYKVFIIDDAHRLTQEAANALLKTIEEPVKDSIIILITAHLDMLFSTIVSRCQKLRFSVMDIKSLSELLNQRYNLPNPEAHFLAHMSEGKIQEAIKFHERKLLGKRNIIIEQILKKRALALESFLENPRDKSNIEDLFTILLSLFRDILLAKLGSPTDALINTDAKDQILSLKGNFTVSYLEELISDIVNLNIYLKENINLKLALDWLSLRISTKENSYERSSLS